MGIMVFGNLMGEMFLLMFDVFGGVVMVGDEFVCGVLVELSVEVEFVLLLLLLYLVSVSVVMSGR